MSSGRGRSPCDTGPRELRLDGIRRGMSDRRRATADSSGRTSAGARWPQNSGVPTDSRPGPGSKGVRQTPRQAGVVCRRPPVRPGGLRRGGRGPSRSAARRCGRRWSAGPAAPIRPPPSCTRRGVPAGARGESLTIEQFAPTIASTCDRHWRMTSATDRGPPPPGRCLRASRQRSTCARGWPAAAGRRPRAEHRLPRFGRPARSWPRMRRTSTGWRTSRRAWGLPDGAGQR